MWQQVPRATGSHQGHLATNVEELFQGAVVVLVVPNTEEPGAAVERPVASASMEARKDGSTTSSAVSGMDRAQAIATPGSVSMSESG